MVSRGNVLVVDDEVNLCRIIGAKLAKSGYSVVVVHDGAQAVEKVRESEFDVVLLDLILPKMDGLAALAEIRNIRSGLPVIVMTACENADAVEQARSYGVSAYVNKPFDLDCLVSLVSNTSPFKSEARDRKMGESTVLFSKDQPITLEVQNGYPGRSYPSRVCDKDEHTLTVLAPCAGNGAVSLHPRASLKVGLTARDAHYSFSTHVLTAVETPERVLVLDKPSVIYRVQRREHLRVPMVMPVGYAPSSRDGSDVTSTLKDAELVDLSRGGACIRVSEKIDPATVLSLELRPQSDIEKLNAVAQVMRAEPAADPDQDGWLLGCQFIIADPSIHKLVDG